MKFWIGVTDANWFNYLASINPDDQTSLSSNAVSAIYEDRVGIL